MGCFSGSFLSTLNSSQFSNQIGVDILPEIVEAVGDRCTVILDSGVRRGSDLVKCVALGAKIALTGRATLYGVGAGGEAGAAKALAILKDELRRTMSYVGCAKVGEISEDVLWKPERAWPAN